MSTPMNKPMEAAVTLASGGEAKFSYLHELVMLHSDDTSSQWAPDTIGVEVSSFGTSECVKVAFHPRSGQNYQSFYFKILDKETLLTFFRALGYPCHQLPEMPTVTSENKEQE